MKRLVTFLFAMLVVVGLASGVYYARRTDPKPEIQTQPVSRGDIVDSVGATGTLEAVTTVQVGTQVSGTVQHLYADFNSIVRRGQVVARLDPSLFQTQVEQAQANLARAEADVERQQVNLSDAETRLARAQELSRRLLIPATELEAAEVAVRAARAQLRSTDAQVVQARASLNQARVNLEHTVISAPIDGIVIARNVDVGQTVAASLQAPTIFIIAADLTKMQVNASIDEADVGRIRPKQTVRFRVDAYPNDEFRGEVVQVRLNPVVQQNVVTYSVVIDVPNPELKLKPGLTANVTIEVASRPQVLRVPTMALRFRPSTDVFAALGQEPPELPMERPGRGQSESAAATPPAEANRAAPQAPASAAARSATRAQPAGQASAPQTARRPDADSTDATEPEGRQGAPARREASADTGAAETIGGRPAGEGAGRPGGFGPGGGPGAFANLTPEQREKRRRQREAMMAQGGGAGMRGPGGDAAGQAAQRTAGQAGPTAAPGTRTMPARQAAARAATPGSATTIDALFGPLPPQVSFARVWLELDGKLTPVGVRLGITDGQFTELLSDELAEGTRLVTNVVTGQQTAVRPTGSGTGNPLMGPTGPAQRGGAGRR